MASQGETASLQLVVRAVGGLDDEKHGIESMLAAVRTLPSVASLADPFAGPGAMSTDRRTAYSTVSLDAATAEVPIADVQTIIQRSQEFQRDGLQVEVGGDLARSASGSTTPC